MRPFHTRAEPIGKCCGGLSLYPAVSQINTSFTCNLFAGPFHRLLGVLRVGFRKQCRNSGFPPSSGERRGERIYTFRPQNCTFGEICHFVAKHENLGIPFSHVCCFGPDTCRFVRPGARRAPGCRTTRSSGTKTQLLGEIRICRFWGKQKNFLQEPARVKFGKIQEASLKLPSIGRALGTELSEPPPNN